MSIPAIRNGLYSVLSGDSTITTIVGTDAQGNPNIFNNQATEGATLPYVLFFLVSGQFPNISPIRETDDLWQIEAVAQDTASASGMETAESLATAIHNAFDHVPITVSGWTNFWITPKAYMHMVENEGGTQYYRVIQEVQIRMQQTS